MSEARGRSAEERGQSGAPSGKARYVRSLFDSIAFRYDLINQVITLGQIGLWRRRVARKVGAGKPKLVLDMGTGTADLAVAIARRTDQESHVLGFDLSPEMLRRAETKAKRHGLQGRISFVLADATALPIKDAVADCLVNGFFLRHLPDLPEAFVEFRRVLRRDGRIAFLELTQPTLPVFRHVVGLWFKRIVPLLGGWLSGNRQAYEYLPNSLRPFPNHHELTQMLKDSGFTSLECQLMGLSAVALHSGARQGK